MVCVSIISYHEYRFTRTSHPDSDPDPSPLVHIDENLDNGPTVVDDIIEGGHNNDYDSDENGGDVDGPRVEAYVNLSQTLRKCYMLDQ